MRPELIRYDEVTGTATFNCAGRSYTVPGLSRTAAELALAEIRQRGNRVFVSLIYECDQRPAVRYRRGLAPLRAV